MWFTASDVGWVVGHSYIVYAPLLTGATTVLYEGKPVGTPDASAFWRVIGDHGVKAMFTAPTAYRAIKREDPTGALMAGHDLSTLETVFLAGERLDPDTYEWASRGARRARRRQLVADRDRLADRRQPARPRADADQARVAVGARCPGYDVQVLDDSGRRGAAGHRGRDRHPAAAARRARCRPCGRTTSATSRATCRSTTATTSPATAGSIDEDGYVYVMGRTDDVLNVAGHRLSTGSIEAALAGHPDVAECAVIGVADDFKGQVPRGLVVLKGGVDAAAEGERIRAELVQRVRDEVGAVASLRQVDIVAGLPKTRSGKILRKTMRELADGKVPTVPGTIEDASVLDALAPVLRPGG